MDGWKKTSNLITGDNNIAYTYDVNGLRNSKTVNNNTTTYYWLNGSLEGQKTGDEYLFFLYDETGTIYGFVVKNGTQETTYYYDFNLQGDVVGIIDSNGSKVVEYSYDVWGMPRTVTGTLADTIGQKNPIRYRGYYYDNETGFYYLQSRYYDPEIGRFINADGYTSTGQDIQGCNMFVYCGNNAVNRYDPTGTFWSSIKNTVKKVISKAKKWVKNTFTQDVVMVDDYQIIDTGEVVRIKAGLEKSVAVEDNANKLKPISLYDSIEKSGKEYSMSSGIKNNVLNTDISIGMNGFSYSKSTPFLFDQISMTYSITTDGYLECEYGYIATWGNQKFKEYISVGVRWDIPYAVYESYVSYATYAAYIGYGELTLPAIMLLQ